MFLRSIRSKIVLWFVIIVAGILSLFSAFVYVNLRNNLYVDTDDLLEVKAEGILASIDVYWRNQKKISIAKGTDIDAFLKANSAAIVATTEHWIEEIPADEKLADISVAIFNVNGELLASSKNYYRNGILSRDLLNTILKGRSSFGHITDIANSDKPVFNRSLTVPIIEDNHVICVLQVVKPLTFVFAALNKLKNTLFIFFPVSLILASFTGFLLANLILGPLKKIIASVRQITAENLKLRIPVPQTKDEIRRLVDTFNQMLEELDKSFSSQQQIVQDISHELRTPLTILKGEMELALKKMRSSHEYEITLRSSLEEINKINRIVENLLMLARFDSHQVKLSFQPIALGELIAGIMQDVRVLSDQKGLHVTVSAGPGISVEGDEMHVRRAILNIVDNAIKYTPQEGTISVVVKEDTSHAIVTISDTGVGIASENLPFIFDRFYRVDASRSSKGFGLGLSIAQAIVEAHRGTVTVASQPGQGTTFTILFPR
ncbi:MAG TPA: heavy metal sensor histidine kinase [Candidatus Omnitrophota bacterium]|nr:heavy metal sensor histidine kinase [Candidatus Omnitrophota bacterium]HPT06951.1 heavy metal sensor histidine kinase [Candidatus Omnitrophota bacterium]